MSWKPLETWAELRRVEIPEDDLPGTPSRVVDVGTGYGNARFALGSNKESRLLIPCSDNDLRLNLEPAGKVTLGFASFDMEGRRQRFIDLVCHEVNLDVVFGELADVLLARLKEGASPSVAVEKTITDFRRLLFAETVSVVDNNKLLGLLGELVVLNSLAKINPECVATWLGPWEQRHDFRRVTSALEVKTSSRSDATEVHINGIDQLQPPAGGELVLVHVCMELSADGSIFIASLYDQLLEAGADKLRLIEGLAELGCLDPHDDAWNRRRYEIQSIEAWSVTAGFPRLTGAEIRPDMNLSAVSELQYKVDLSQASNYRMSQAEYDAYLNQLMA